MQADPVGSIQDVNVLLKGTDQLKDKNDGVQFSFKSVLYETWMKRFNPGVFTGMQAIAYDFAFYQPSSVPNVDDFKELVVRTKNCATIGERSCTVSLQYRSSTADVTYHFFDNSPQSEAQENACEQAGFANCLDALDSLRNAIAPYNYFIKIGHTGRVIKRLHELNTRWNEFSAHSRHQTFIDKWLTTRIYRDEYNGKDWVGPPKYQYFLFHPDLVLDQYSNAQRGDQTKISLAIEWVGINKWEGKVPLGISLASVYTDRVSGKRLGLGLMFHIDNNYSIGVVDRGDNHYSVFVNLNLFNWFTEKQDKYELYRDRLKNIRGH
ncbi:MAG: hypothetical protein P8019_16680 [Gammaproteobacteria bacterium]